MVAGCITYSVEEVPSEWNRESVSYCFLNLSNNTFSRDQLNNHDGPAQNIHYGDVLVRYGEVLDCNAEDVPYVNAELEQKVSKLPALQDGDIVLADTAEDSAVGKVTELRNAGGSKIVAGLHTIALRPKEPFAPGFLGYQLNHGIYRYQIMPFVTGIKVSSIAKKALADTVVFRPPYKEQMRIAEALSDVDGLIDNLEKLLEKKKNIKTGAMQELLTGKRRLPGFDGEWEDVNLGSTSKLRARIGWQGLRSDEYLNDGYAYLVTGTDFDNGFVDWKHAHYVTKDRFDQDENIQLHNDDVLVTKDGSIGKTALVANLEGPATLNSGVFVLRSKHGEYDQRYMYYVLLSEIFRDFLTQLQAGSTISHLYQKDFVHFTFKAPALVEQRAIAEVLSDMDIEISQLQGKLDKYKRLKVGMMDELLTGRIRLVD